MPNPNLNSSVKRITLFDLDRTVISSDHRTPYNDNGDLCLSTYRKMQTHSNIMKDELLPLASFMRELIERGEPVGIVTARRMTKSDYIYLRQRGLRPAVICSRDQLFKKFPEEIAKTAYHSGDAIYKSVWFGYLRERFPLAEFVIYDDHKGVLDAAKTFGFQAWDAVQLNDMIAHFLDLGFSEGFAIGYHDGTLDRDVVYRAVETVQQVIRYDEDQAA